MIYLIQCIETGYVKIGRAHNPRERLRGMQVAAPGELRLMLTIESESPDGALESSLHTCFGARRLHGEWFALTPGDIEMIKRLPIRPATGERAASNGCFRKEARRQRSAATTKRAARRARCGFDEVTDSDLRPVIDLHLSGQSYGALARTFGVSKQTVHYWCTGRRLPSKAMRASMNRVLAAGNG